MSAEVVEALYCTSSDPRRVEGFCAACVLKDPGRQPGRLVIVGYLADRVDVAVSRRSGGVRHATMPLVTGPEQGGTNPPTTSTVWERLERGKKLAQMECGSCSAKPRKSRQEIRQAADAARARGDRFFWVHG